MFELASMINCTMRATQRPGRAAPDGWGRFRPRGMVVCVEITRRRQGGRRQGTLRPLRFVLVREQGPRLTVSVPGASASGGGRGHLHLLIRDAPISPGVRRAQRTAGLSEVRKPIPLETGQPGARRAQRTVGLIGVAMLMSLDKTFVRLDRMSPVGTWPHYARRDQGRPTNARSSMVDRTWHRMRCRGQGPLQGMMSRYGMRYRRTSFHR